MSNLKARTKVRIESLKKEEAVFRVRLEEIRQRHTKPTEWIKDPDFKAIGRERRAAEDERLVLEGILAEIEDKEWTDRMAKEYPDGEV